MKRLVPGIHEPSKHEDLPQREPAFLIKCEQGVHGRQSLLWSVNPSGAPCSAGTDQEAADTWMTATLCACNSHCGTEHLATSMSVSCMPEALGTENAVLQCFLPVSRCVSVCLRVYVRAKCCGQVAADACFRAPDPRGEALHCFVSGDVWSMANLWCCSVSLQMCQTAKPPVGCEPTTSRLLSGCSTN